MNEQNNLRINCQYANDFYQELGVVRVGVNNYIYFAFFACYTAKWKYKLEPKITYYRGLWGLRTSLK